MNDYYSELKSLLLEYSWTVFSMSRDNPILINSVVMSYEEKLDNLYKAYHTSNRPPISLEKYDKYLVEVREVKTAYSVNYEYIYKDKPATLIIAESFKGVIE